MLIQDMQNDVIMDGGAFAELRRAGARQGSSASWRTCGGSPTRRARAA